MKPYFLIGAFVIFISFLSCSSSSEPLTKFIEGTYSYFAYDNNSQLVISGTLFISQIDSTRLQGSWQLSRINNAERTGPQFGSGNLTGVIENGNISINLNPNYADNNVILEATFGGAGFSGKWKWIGFAGILNGGSFEALRKRF